MSTIHNANTSTKYKKDADRIEGRELLGFPSPPHTDSVSRLAHKPHDPQGRSSHISG